MSNKKTRREFLEESMFAITAAGAAAYGFSAGSLSAQPSQAAKRAAANERIGIMLVGAGSRGGDHIGNYLGDKRVAILYLCDPDPSKISDKRLDEIAVKQDGIRPKAVADLRKGLDDKSVDVVSCATTNHWHTLTGIWALQSGRPCYLEKPLTHNIFEGIVIEAAAKKYKLPVQVGTQCRSATAQKEAVKFIRDGGIGDVKFARGMCYKRRPSIGPLKKDGYPIPKEIDYDLWSGPAQILPMTRPKFHYDWHWQREYGNGDMGNQGPHQTDIARWFLDLDRYPNSVITYGGRLGYQAERKDPNYVDAGDTANTEVSIFDYGDKCIVFETRGLETKPCTVKGFDKIGAGVGVIAYGSKGYLVQSLPDRQTYDYCAAFDLDGNLIKEFKGGGNHYKNFIDAVIANDPSLLNANARCGALSAALSHMGNISYYLGEGNKVSAATIATTLKGVKSLDDNQASLDRTVKHLEENGVDLAKYPISLGPHLKFDPEKIVFEDPKARELATRNYRTPYVVPKPEDV